MNTFIFFRHDATYEELEVELAFCLWSKLFIGVNTFKQNDVAAVLLLKLESKTLKYLFMSYQSSLQTTTVTVYFVSITHVKKWECA